MNTNEYRNLAEQVLKNKEDILKHFKRDEVLADFGIRIIGTLQEAVELEDIPTEGLQYGDAYAVGTKSPYSYYIWTRADATNQTDYWFNFGEIAIAGPAGPTGPRGLKGEDGKSSQWYYIADGIENVEPMDYNEGDMVLDSKGNVYRCTKHPVTPRRYWTLVTNIIGPQGANGKPGRTGDRGAQGPQGEKGEKGDVGGFINIVGIVDSEELLPDPTVLDNLTYAYLVGLSNPRELYVQVGENSNEAQWLNTGAFNAATLVTAGGENQNIWDSDVKLNRITQEHDRMVAYVQNSDGTDTWREITSWGLPDSLAMYYQDENGQGLLESPGVPTAPEHVINKEYFDGVIKNIGTGHVRTYVFDSLDKSRWDSATINGLYELVDYANEIYFDNYRDILPTDQIFMLRYTPESNVPEYLLPYNVTITRTSLSNHQAAYKITFSYLRKAPTDNLIDIQVTLATNHNYMRVDTYQQDVTNILLDWQYLNANLQIPRRFSIPYMPGSDKVGQYFNGDGADDYMYGDLRDMIETVAAYEYFEQYGDGAAYEGFNYDFYYYNGNQFTKIKVEEGTSDSEWRVTLGLLDEGTWKEWTVDCNLDEYTFYLYNYRERTFQVT